MSSEFANPRGSSQEGEYVMTIDLNVLNHLGINLYSNLPAVLSEAVANSYDADASRVEVLIDTSADTITIVDDGIGMTHDEMNARFLKVGYQRRSDSSVGSGPESPSGRKVMGRKGIGKLSLFSIANVIEVRSAACRPLEGGTVERAGCILDVDGIMSAIEEGRTSYMPRAIPADEIELSVGTTITLKRLKKNPSHTAGFLERRLARRFATVGKEFQLFIDGEQVPEDDKILFDLLRYVWIYGDDDAKERISEQLPNQVEVRQTPPLEVDGLTMNGWIGAAVNSGSLKEAEGSESLNRIMLYVRGKLAQEDLLPATGNSGLFTKFLLGKLRADFLDLDDKADIATSSRQAIVEDDPRYVSLATFVKGEVVRIGSEWNDLRERDAVASVTSEVPSVRRWLDTLQGDERTSADRFLGRLNTIPIDGDDRVRLFRSGVLAFEALRRRRRLSVIDATATTDLEALLSAFHGIDDVEAAAFYEISRDRLSIIERFEDYLDEDALERILQEYLFDHLWLLDPSWERTTTPLMEATIAKLIGDKANEPTKRSRVDIKYRRTGGVHVIVELKRGSVVTSTAELMDQIQRYRQPVLEALRSAEGEHVALQTVCVVGKDLSDWADVDGRNNSAQALAPYHARVITYSSLVRQAKESYGDYLSAHSDAGELISLLGEMEQELLDSMTRPSGGQGEA